MQKKGVMLKEYGQLNGSPVARYVMRHVGSLDDGGFYRTQMLISWDDQVVVAYAGSKPVGVITYKKIDWERSHVVTFAFVEPKCRRRGIYGQMWKRLVELVGKTDCRWIVGAVHPANGPMTAAMRGCGRKPFRVLYEYEVR